METISQSGLTTPIHRLKAPKKTPGRLRNGKAVGQLATLATTPPRTGSVTAGVTTWRPTPARGHPFREVPWAWPGGGRIIEATGSLSVQVTQRTGGPWPSAAQTAGTTLSTGQKCITSGPWFPPWEPTIWATVLGKLMTTSREITREFGGQEAVDP